MPNEQTIAPETEPGRGRRLAARIALAGIAVAAVYLGVLYLIVTARFEGQRWRLPSKIYADSFILHPGQDIAAVRLAERLRRLGYRSVAGTPARGGEYRLAPDALDLYLHDFDYPDHAFKGLAARLAISDGVITDITDKASEERLALVELEPELITAFYDETWEARELVRLIDLPPHLINAVLAAEDHRFYTHPGVDWRGIARAMWVNLKARAIVQGGSTLTQQLVKNFYLHQDRTLTRKFNELFMSLMLDLRYSKDEILEAYLNEIYLAQNGSMGIFGVGEASRFYFGKGAADLTPGESAVLAGLIKSPNLYSPFHNPDRARDRRNAVLNRMLELDLVAPELHREALREPVPRVPPALQQRVAPYFVDFVRQQLAEHYSPDTLNSEGLRIFTPLDLQLQREAERILDQGLNRLEGRFPALRKAEAKDGLQGSLIVLQPQTGQIKAMVGGRDYAVSQFNRATQAHRQPGSLFKPFVYAAAIAEGGRTAASIIDDSPIRFETETGTWAPNNYDKVFHGPVTLRTALEHSLNAATVRLADEIGMDRVIEMARSMGIESAMSPVPSLALGTSEVVPLEMTVAYATIASGGIRVIPLAIKEVVDPFGRVLERRTLEMTPVLTPQQAFLLTSLLEGVVLRGTAAGAKQYGFARPAAGKTGTTSQYKDAWFAGFTPDLLTVVWVGFDTASPGAPAGEEAEEAIRLTGAQAALPIWAEFMKAATDGQPVSDFDAVPPGIVFQTVDPKTGLLSSGACPDGLREAFIEGTEPRETCDGSGGVPKKLFQWFKQLLPR